jgi:hypothetical protein
LANDENVNTQSGYLKLNIKEIKQIPALAGEPDILKSVQFLPGVQVSNEGTTNISVRGGSFDQNLIILDEALVYNPNHTLSFISVFNSDAIQNVDFYKSAFPAKYGGRMSSVIDVQMKEGNKEQFTLTGGIGLVMSRLSLEGPIVKDKSSFIISGRYSYLGLVVNSLVPFFKETFKISNLNNFRTGNEVDFYDLNLKTNISINTKNHLYLSAYTGNDHFYFKNFTDDYSLDWGNLTSSARWYHVFNNMLFSNTTFAYSKYYYKYLLKEDTKNFIWSSNMKNYLIKTDFDYFASNSTKFQFGLQINYLNLLPGEIQKVNSSSVINPFKLSLKKSIDISPYFEISQKIKKFNIQAGIRTTLFSEIGKAKQYIYSNDLSNVIDSIEYGNLIFFNTYIFVEPRITLNYLINERSSVYASYSVTNQNTHLMRNSSVGMPTDIWQTTTKYIKPERTIQYVLGYAKRLNNKIFAVSYELYYKNLYNVIDFKDNANLFINPYIETEILSGKGEAYGFEFYLRKTSGKLNGWISYTFSRCIYNIPGINNDQSYYPVFHKPHNFSLFSVYKINNSLSISGTFKLTSGGRITMPVGTFDYYGASFNYYSQKNGYTLPIYHQLDLSLNYSNSFNSQKRWKSEWVISVINVYNRKNVFSMFVSQKDENMKSTKVYKMYLYGIFPSITYNFKF